MQIMRCWEKAIRELEKGAVNGNASEGRLVVLYTCIMSNNFQGGYATFVSTSSTQKKVFIIITYN